MTDLRDQLQHTLGAAYALDRELGGGGMSRVFVAEESALGRQVVVKVLSPELTGGVNLDRFKREIQLAARLQHPHIVPLLAAGDVDGLPYFTMPLVEGESLGARLRRGELPVSEAVAILRDVAKALEYAHAKGIVHRDIKPDNVLLSGGSATVTDFGVAKAVSGATLGDGTLTGRGIALGTPAYMAPEQAAADPHTDHRADIYAFGVMAYEMLAGRSPFAGRSSQQMLTAHVTEVPLGIDRVRPAVPPALAELVMRCLEKRAADRPQSARELLVALDAVGTPTASTSASLGTARRQWVIGTAVGAVIVAGVAAVPAYRSLARPPIARRLVVAPLVDLTGDTAFATLGRIAADMITQGIQQTETIDVVSSSVVTVATGNEPGGSSTPSDLARRVHASTLVSGAVYKQGDSLRFQAQVTDVASGRLVQAVEGVMAPVSNPMVGVIALRDRLMGTVAISDAQRASSLGTGAPKFEAYREFAQGSERFVQRNYAAAAPFVERAIAIDSSFGAAYVTLAAAHVNLGHYANADTVIQAADRHRSEFSRADRLMLDYTHGILEHDRERALKAVQEWAARDSAPLSLYLVGLSANYLNRPRLAVNAFAHVRDTLFFTTGWSPYFTNYAASHHMLGEFKEELQVARRLEKLYTPFFASRIRALAGRGELTALNTLLDSLGRYSMDTVSTAGDYMVTAARELRAHGREAAADSILRRARVWFESRPPAERQRVSWRRSVANVLYELSAFDSARTIFTSLVGKDSTNLADRGRLGAIAAHLGDRPGADSIASALSRVRIPYTFGEQDYQRAVIAAASGDKAAAVQLLQAAIRAGTYFGLRFHTEREFQSLRGYEPFDAILRPSG